MRLQIPSFRYPGRKEDVLSNLEIRLLEGECLALVGPSGCGKSTIWRLLAGLTPIRNGGGVALGPDGNPFNINGVVKVPDKVAVTFQEARRSLLPWFTVYENIEWAYRIEDQSAKERQLALENVLNLVNLEKKRNNFPHELSGGEVQRCALARALIHSPEVLLLDEPFSSLDVFARHSLEDLILELKQNHEISIILITHEAEEAVLLGDKIIILTHIPCQIYQTQDAHEVSERGTEQFYQQLARLSQTITILRSSAEVSVR